MLLRSSLYPKLRVISLIFLNLLKESNMSDYLVMSFMNAIPTLLFPLLYATNKNHVFISFLSFHFFFFSFLVLRN